MSARKKIRVCAALLALFLLPGTSQAATQELRQGDTGETVTVLTRRLGELGFIGDTQNVYNEAVVSAVSDFQTANGLARTGEADTETQQALYSDHAVNREAYLNAFARRYADVNLTGGSGGDQVKQLQSALAELDYYAYTPDGVFGDVTRQAVAQYQEANGLPVTGTADASTLMRLFEGESVRYADYIESRCAGPGEFGAKVKNIQQRLNDLGYFAGDATGTYGENTQRAVTCFQTSNFLPGTGNVDDPTYRRLFGDGVPRAGGENTLFFGDSGDAVNAVRQRLTELGYLENADGAFDRRMQTALMLFCAASGREIAPFVTEETAQALFATEAPYANTLLDAEGGVDEARLAQICENAVALAGETFEAGEELFPGYEFVRYLFAGAGVALGDVSNAVAAAGADHGEPMPGDVVLFSRDGGQAPELSFGLCVADGMLVLVNRETDRVETVPFSALSGVECSVWHMGR